MNARVLAPVLFLGLAAAAAAQDPDAMEVPPVDAPAELLFVRREVNLREAPSAASSSLGLVEPGTFATELERSPDGGFVRVKTEDAKEGWIAKDFLNSYRALQLRRAFDALPDFEVVGTGNPFGMAPQTHALRRASAIVCPNNLLACPAIGCVNQDALDKQALNRSKRFFPKTTSAPKRLTFDILKALQAEVNDRGVPMDGDPLVAADRKLLKDVRVDGETYSPGDYVELVGYIAPDRNVSCGGAESVNCKLSSANKQTGPCDKSDIHVPLVEEPNHTEWKSVVTEPIAQGRPTSADKVTAGKNVDLWTPPWFDDVKDAGTLLKVRGGLFYDSEHIVNKNPNAPKGNEPKRFTLLGDPPANGGLHVRPRRLRPGQ